MLGLGMRHIHYPNEGGRSLFGQEAYQKRQGLSWRSSTLRG